jgi:hypothetical protein
VIEQGCVLLRCMSLEVALRDILHCHASSVANGA